MKYTLIVKASDKGRKHIETDVADEELYQHCQKKHGQ